MKNLLLITLFLVSSASFNANALGIDLHGSACLDQKITATDTFSVFDEPVTSAITVLATNPDGTFQLVVTGGIPRIDDAGFFGCIETDIPFGHKTTTSTAPLSEGNSIREPSPHKQASAVGYWNGDDLVITMASIYQEGAAFEDDGIMFSSSLFPVSTTLIFNLSADGTAFRLLEVLRTVGSSSARSVTGIRPVYIDSISPPTASNRFVRNLEYKIFQ